MLQIKAPANEDWQQIDNLLQTTCRKRTTPSTKVTGPDGDVNSMARSMSRS